MILSELFTLLRFRVNYESAMRVVSSFRNANGFTVHYVDRAFDDEIWATISRLRGIPLSHADASLLVLGERLGLRSVFSFDSDFALAGFDLVPGA